MIMIAAITISSAQSITSKISGSVTDEQQKAQEFVTISLLGAKDSALVRTAFSDISGNYVFERVSPGEYLVSATMIGYKKAFSKNFILKADHLVISVEKLKLIMVGKSLKEVTVTAQKPFIERKMDKLILNVEGSSISAGSTAMEVLEKAPGVIVDKDDNISMKGKSGVLIMLDGKPTYMSSADVAGMLRNMQSSQIESIELITSPSARYDAAGTSGIINIKTRKSKNMGLNGSLTAGGGYGQTSKYTAGTILNYRNGKYNVFGNYNYGNTGRINALNLNREVTFNNVLTNFNQDNSWDSRRNSNSFKIGMDYFINKNHTVGVLVNGYANRNNESSLSNTRMLNNSFKMDSTIMVTGRNKQSYQNLAYNFNYKGILDTTGKELTVDLDYSNYNGKLDELRDNYYYDTNGSNRKAPQFVKNYAPAEIDVKSFKLDYTHPLNKSSKFEAGIKSSWVTTDNNLFFGRLAGTTWVSDPDVSNHFVYDENIYAGYMNYNTEFKKTGIQMGLRAEQTQSIGNSITKGQKVIDRNYLEFFPSMSLSQKWGKNHQLGLSYSRRINRPAYDDLNPFLYFLDEYTYKKGNEFLKPQFTNSLDLSHTFKGTFTTSVNFSRTTDAMVFVTEQDDATKKTLATQLNLDTQDVLGLNVYAPFRLRKWWNINNNFQVFNTRVKSDLSGGNLKTDQTAITYNMDHSFTINKSISADAGFQYQSPMQYSIFKMDAQYVMNAGLRKSFMNKKANLRLSLNDVFNTKRGKFTTTYQNMNLNFTEKGETQIGRITFSYNFGKNEIKPARRRSTGLEDESKRMKN